MRPQNVCILNVGTPRTIAHPTVAATFMLFRQNLVADNHRVFTFLWLSDSAAANAKKFAHRAAEASNSASALIASAAWHKVLGFYAPTLINVSAADLPCHYRGCRAFLCTNKYAGPENPSSFMSQRFKVMLAFRTAKAYAAARSFAFDWYIRTRTDLLHLQPLIHLAQVPLEFLALRLDLGFALGVDAPRALAWRLFWAREERLALLLLLQLLLLLRLGHFIHEQGLVGSLHGVLDLFLHSLELIGVDISRRLAVKRACGALQRRAHCRLLLPRG